MCVCTFFITSLIDLSFFHGEISYSLSCNIGVKLVKINKWYPEKVELFLSFPLVNLSDSAYACGGNRVLIPWTDCE